MQKMKLPGLFAGKNHNIDNIEYNITKINILFIIPDNCI